MVTVLILFAQACAGGLQRVAAADARAPHGADEIPPVRAAADQEEALRLARQEDLPALQKADRVVVKADGRQVVVTAREALDELRQGLKPRKVPPSAGETAYTLTFSRGPTPIRTVWVYHNGEWGFDRPDGPSWTIGCETDLIRAIKRLKGMKRGRS